MNFTLFFLIPIDFYVSEPDLTERFAFKWPKKRYAKLIPSGMIPQYIAQD